MLAQISSPKLTEWMAFSILEPFGFTTNMFGHGIVAAMIGNVNRRKGSKAFNAQDFVPETGVVSNKSKSFFANLKSMLFSMKDK